MVETLAYPICIPSIAPSVALPYRRHTMRIPTRALVTRSLATVP